MTTRCDIGIGQHSRITIIGDPTNFIQGYSRCMCLTSTQIRTLNIIRVDIYCEKIRGDVTTRSDNGIGQYSLIIQRNLSYEFIQDHSRYICPMSTQIMRKTPCISIFMVLKY